MNALALHTDKYQINMMYAHWANGTHRNRAVFDMYFRKPPFANGYAVFAGLERVVRYVQELRFTEEELDYLAGQEEGYSPDFLEVLRSLRFTGEIYSVPEGTIVFPGEPLMRIEAPILEAQLIETALLNFVNYQTLVATKAARIKHIAGEDGLLEFGTRRAQEADAAVWGARAAYLAGFHATSNLRAGMLFGIPTKGTHAHSWVQMHDSESEAFDRFAAALPDQVTLLVDTYDTLRSGVPNAIRTAKAMEARGKRMQAIRLDSGDLAYLSKRARAMLDEAGLSYVRIVASNDLDEHILFDLKAQGARIDTWGVGTKLITAKDDPALGGVYKLVAREQAGILKPVIKISANPEKVTTPGAKEVYRIINRQSGKAIADYIASVEETDMQEGKPLRLFDPIHPYLQQEVGEYEAIPLLQPVFQKGKLVYDLPGIEHARAFHREGLRQFWPEYLRRMNPEKYPVDLSPNLWQMRERLLQAHMR
ncbi:nicotinate phosphoribosyltransferase [Xylanibacillus composti]|uniref:Nicotinate phosphoribosyltransferase n=1 Tax=Xylanibacillus composti TaxID=1572762 RepID=A0A8J4H971_9BACL|nr:nicotinate phosphoribosyltransferase [Xylanibacillus composti]MDT9725728.1 nicotinate phosphoribosyltransferase [Xylanibacillus composti]GIQ71133.1 nicotinate phosphoribosyltransferase [Xylanibacillus composti]